MITRFLQSNGRRNIAFRRMSLLVAALIGLSCETGCRRQGKAGPQFYERELISKKQQEEANAPSVKPLSDRYPWQGRKYNGIDGIEERIINFETQFDAGMKAHNRVMNRGRERP